MTDQSLAALRKARLANWIAAMSLRAEADALSKTVEADTTPPHEASILRFTARMLERAGNELIRTVQTLNDHFECGDDVHDDYDKWLADGRPALTP